MVLAIILAIFALIVLVLNKKKQNKIGQLNNILVNKSQQNNLKKKKIESKIETKINDEISILRLNKELPTKKNSNNEVSFL